MVERLTNETAADSCRLITGSGIFVWRKKGEAERDFSFQIYGPTPLTSHG